MEQRNSFGYWMRRRRKALDLTQTELAHQVGCALGTIQKLEGDERRPSKQLAARLANLLQIPSQDRDAFLKVARGDMATDQLALGDRPLEIPPAPAFKPPVAALPVPATPMIGREREVAAVTDMLRQRHIRLVTLTGPGGIGKTRLALQVAMHQVDAHNDSAMLRASNAAGLVPFASQLNPGTSGESRFPDGVWFVNLAPISAPDLVAATIARALELREIDELPFQEVLKRSLREKKLLLLLDNFEQVVEAAPLIGELVMSAPGLSVLVTSRMPLHLAGEYEFAVPPLGLPPPREPANDPAAQPQDRFEIEQYEAVRLFAERARAAKADFTLADEDADAVAEICRRLDGLPLAIRLAAARVKLFSPRALLSRLDERLALLTGGPRDMPARQQTIRDTIDWSYQLLDENEKTIFARLAVFVGGCTIEAAEATVPTSQGSLSIVDGLASLVDKSMIRQVNGLGGEPRFVMLETIREYALERLELSGEAETIRRRHAEYFLELAERYWQHDKADAEVEVFEQFEREIDNLRAAMDWSHASEDAAAIEMRLVAVLTHFLTLRGYVVEGWERLKAALLRGSPVADELRSGALGAIGASLVHYRGDLDQARVLIEEGLALAERFGDTSRIAWQLMCQGTIAGFQGDYQAASAFFEQSRTMYEALDDTWGLSVIHFCLGQVAYLRHDLERASVLIERSLELCRQSINTTWATARRLITLGSVALAQGLSDRARSLFAEGLTLSRDSGAKVDTPMGLVGLAGLVVERGQAERAARLLGSAQALSERFGAYRGLTGEHIQEQVTAAVRAQIDPDSFDTAWAAGRALRLEEAVALALRELVLTKDE
jgi:predicted ATPase/DNA-binding XRE family transcriptional regulator